MEEVLDHDLQIATYHSITTNDGRFDDEHDFSRKTASPPSGLTPNTSSSPRSFTSALFDIPPPPPRHPVARP
eukprot:7357564-Karenia_brevis.AAC.1